MEVNHLVDPSFLDRTTKYLSFLDALSGNSSNSRFPKLQTSSFCGFPSLWISEEEFLAFTGPFHYVLVGFFPSRRPSLDSICRFFFNLKINGDVFVTLLDQSHILVKLVNDLVYSIIFCHRSYLVNNCYMKLTKWPPFVDINIGVEYLVIPIWISFSNLWSHLFSPRILHGLGSRSTVKATSIDSRPYVACILAELDITKKYPDKVWLGPKKFRYIQQVAMEVFPLFCGSCKSIWNSKGDYRPHSPSSLHVVYPNVSNHINVNNNHDENVVDVLDNLDNFDIHPVDNIGMINDEFCVENANVVEVGANVAENGNVIGYLVEGADQLDSILPVDVSIYVEDEPSTSIFPWLSLVIIMKILPLVLRDGVDSMVDVSINAPLTPVERVLSNLPIIDVQVALISNEALKAKLAVIMNVTSVDHNDWLDDSSSPYGGDGEDLNVFMEEDHAVYNLVVSHFVDKAFALGRDKRQQDDSGSEDDCVPPANQVRSLTNGDGVDEGVEVYDSDKDLYVDVADEKVILDEDVGTLNFFWNFH
ncbi:hypothetical protein M5K25_020300 [Dendrobium thyrsiflorum]|uniref:DUF4283 domain-containing protein n=1 Tax=Dendrobium thyrsiflorum TaxID=117978 RepID=A0ABD0U9P1_DENTH